MNYLNKSGRPRHVCRRDQRALLNGYAATLGPLGGGSFTMLEGNSLKAVLAASSACPEVKPTPTIISADSVKHLADSIDHTLRF
jgi:hypothetical protein